MILAHPATLGTIVWILLTLTVVALFAGRGVSAVWSASTSLVRGVRDWAGRPDPGAEHVVSPRAVELPPLPAAGSAGAPQAPRLPRVINAGAAARWRDPDVEVEELDTRRLP
jgi:hypothetical protein